MYSNIYTLYKNNYHPVFISFAQNKLKKLHNLKYWKKNNISTIIILRVSFCSDIWYCNILAYYLDTQYNNDINVVLSR